MPRERALFESAATHYIQYIIMSNAMCSDRKSNPSRRICHLRSVLLGHVANSNLETPALNRGQSSASVIFLQQNEQGPTKHRKELQGTTRNYKVLLNLQNA